MKRHWSEILIELGACSDAVEWAKTQKSRADAWKNCKRGYWMLWLLSKSNPPETDKVKFVKTACEIARLVLKYVPEGEDRPRLAIEAAEGWIAFQDDKQRAAGDAAWAAGDAARAAARAAARDAAAKIVRKHFPKPPSIRKG